MFPNLFTNDSSDMAEENTSKSNDDKKSKKHNQKTHTVKKRTPVKPVEGDNVFFINRKTNFKAQLDKCSDLLTKGEKEIILHGLGAAIQRCCNLAMQLQLAFQGTHEVEINTDTIDLVDDLIPKDEMSEFDIQYRYQSSVHIRIFRTAMIGAN